jgi:translation initiation factor 3 subunit C
MVQLGLCAFRNGLIKDAHACLHEIMATQKAKELLAQGVQNPRHQDKTAEEEKIEKRRQLPFHMHINYELLECVYLTTALLIEVPNMAANRFDHRRRIVSKPFRKYWDIIERQLFQGPPENTREHVIAAARALHNGDWRQCHKYLMDIKAWNLFPAADTVKTMLRSEVQTQGIRTYLLEYSGAYASLHIDDLCAMFELERPAVHAIVSKMIINEELHATWDQPTNTVLIHQEEPSRLQALAVQFADKAAQLVENNDRLYEVRVGASAQQQTQRNTGSSGGSGGNSGGGGNSSGSGYYRKDSQLRNRSTQGGQQRGGNYRSYSNAGGNSSTGNADYSRNYAR